MGNANLSYSSMDQLEAIMSGTKSGVTELAPETHDFVVKGGETQTVLAGGMVRSSSANKTDYSLALDGVMFNRLAEHLTKATRPPSNYPKRNWLLAGHGSPADKDLTLARYHESAVRHFLQWLRGETDEDHAAAVFFNINGYETLKATMS